MPCHLWLVSRPNHIAYLVIISEELLLLLKGRYSSPLLSHKLETRMSAEEDTTQPIEAPELHVAPIAPYARPDTNGEAINQSATLPSTAIGGHNDTNKLAATDLPPVAVLPIASALPFAQALQALPDYHKPAMSQADGTLFDDSGLFTASAAVSSPVPTAPPQLESESQTEHNDVVTTENPPHSPSEKTVTDVFPKSSNSGASDAADDGAIHVNYAHETSKPVSAPHMGDSIEEPMEVGEVVQAVNADGDGNNSSVEISERDRDLAAMHELMASAQEERITSMKSKAPAPAEVPRSTRKKRVVSHSQGVSYTYQDTGTLQDDSEDEDGGWNSDDEIRATQLCEDSDLFFVEEKGSSTGPKKRANAESEEDDEAEVQPVTKKRKQIESEDSVVHKHQISQAIPEDDDIEYIGSTSAPKTTTVIDDTSMETDEAPTSRPRPSLGNVGSSSKTTETGPSKASTPSKKSTTAKSSASTAMEIDAPHSTQKSIPPSSAQAKVATPKKVASKNASAIAVHGEDDVNMETTSQADRSASTPSHSQHSTKSSTTPKKTSNTPKSSQVDYVDEVSQRPKRTRPTSQPTTPSKPSNSGSSKEKIPTAELARVMRKNARESIARYLQQESDDMMDFFTQRHVDMSSSESQDAPPNMFKRFSFIISGLRSVSEAASSASFIKMQIKALGGKLANFRPPQRKKVKRSVNGEESFELGMAQTILISEKPQRTLKYINALASGVPCVHYRWLLACLHQGKLIPLEEFLLPAGYNEDSALVPIPSWFVQEDQEDVPYYERYPFLIADEDDEDDTTMDAPKEQQPKLATRKATKRSKRAAPDNYRVEVIGTHAFQQQWKSILKQVGAKIVERLDAARDYGTLDFVLSDAEPTDLHIKLSQARGLPLCTIDWALQSIIQRKVQDPMSKPAYTLNTDDF